MCACVHLLFVCAFVYFGCVCVCVFACVHFVLAVCVC